MKKTFTLFALVLLQLATFAQQSIIFKIALQPSKIYTSTMNTLIDVSMDMKGTPEAMKTLKAKNVQLPMIIKGNNDMEYKTATGVLNETQQGLPVIITYTKINNTRSMNGKPMPVPRNPLLDDKIYGQFTGGKFKIDSISGANDQLKEMLLKTMSSVMNQVKFPDKALTIGDSFTQEMPIALPIPGVSAQFIIKMIYKLTSITDDLAYFDLDESATFNISGDAQLPIGVAGEGSGKGSGKCIFNIKGGFISVVESSLTYNYNIKIHEMNITGTAITTSSHKTTVADK